MGPTSLIRRQSRSPRTWPLALVACLAVSALPGVVQAETPLIGKPGRHPRYRVEGEAHLLAGLLEGPAPEDDSGFGVGLRANWEIVDNGFVPKINNTVAVGVGLDYLNWGASDVRVNCEPILTTGGETCDVASQTFYELVVPVVLQWNFWFTRHWSAFAEPGFALRARSHTKDRFEPLIFFVGGRYKLSRQALITARVGFPYTSVGFSWIY